MLPERDFYIERDFPNILSLGYKISSPRDVLYNCIAWVVDDKEKWWWPHPDTYWPDGVERVLTLEAFIKAYSTKDFSVCDTGDIEEGYEKIVIYVDTNNIPTHAAKQISQSEWSSKIGNNHDIRHTLEGLISHLYGRPATFLKRRTVEKTP